MATGDRYRKIIIISYILLVICSFILLAGLWNHLSMNQDVHIGNGLYFLVISIIILTTAIFVLHLLGENRGMYSGQSDKGTMNQTEENIAEASAESYEAPFEVDIDLIAEDIVPRINPRESIEDYTERILVNLAKYFNVVQAIFYLKNAKSQEFESVCTYAYTSETGPAPFKIGEGIPGQVAKNKTIMNLTSLPEGYMQMQSGLGDASPRNLVIIPLLLNKETIGIIELASFQPPDQEMEWTYRNLAKIIGNAIITKIKSSAKK
jgi:transcriptional regulator with GAF, ATPase, and Fis domain